MRVAVIGFGRQGKRRAEWLAKTPGVDEVVAYDSAYDAYDAASKLGCVSWVAESAAEAITKTDAVAVCTPSTLHYDVAHAALEAGKHLLVEKPLTCKADEAWQLVRLAERKRLALHCGLNMRYRDPVLAAKKLLPKVGRIDGVYIKVGHARFGNDRDNPRYKLCGGALLDQGVHGLDIALELLGWPKGDSSCELSSGHDYGFFSGTFVGGIDLVLHAHLDEDVGTRVTFHGQAGTVDVRMGDGRDWVELWGGVGDKAPKPPWTMTLCEDFAFPDQCWARDCAAFVAACQGGPSNGAQAARLVELLT